MYVNMKLNLGCGLDYKEDFVNVDFNKEVKADRYFDLNDELGMPFKDNSVEYVYMDNTLEHIKDIFPFMDELWRVCKDRAIIEIYVPHYTSTSAFKHLAHYHYFGATTMELFHPILTGKSGERYCKANFIVRKEKLLVLSHNSQYFPFLISISKVINWFFNIGGTRMKLFWEKFNIFGFEEIYYKLECVK